MIDYDDRPSGQCDVTREDDDAYDDLVAERRSRAREAHEEVWDEITRTKHALTTTLSLLDDARKALAIEAALHEETRKSVRRLIVENKDQRVRLLAYADAENCERNARRTA